jgi:hypothetical protein
MVRLVGGFQVSQAIHTAVVLGLPDHLSTGPKSASDLAMATRTDPASLYRLMRALAAVGVIHEDDQRRFELTAMGTALRTDVTRSLAPIVRLQCRSSHWQAWDNLLHAVRTGATSFEYVHGSDAWKFRAEHRDEGDAFDNAMAAFAHQVADAFLEVCDFSHVRHVVDVGGGDGTLLARVLEANPHVRATLLEQPHVVERARRVMDEADVSGRCELIGGDFFEGIPSGGDVYLLKWILHDWDDAAAVGILRSCRRAMTTDCRLMIVEHLVGPRCSSSTVMLRDLQMLVVTGGRERTRDEFEHLLSAAGFVVRSLMPTSSPLWVIEASPVDD